MKRPEGYGGPSAPPQGSRPAPAGRSGASSSAARQSRGDSKLAPERQSRAQASASKPVTAPKPPASGRRSGEERAADRARAAEAELRAARRERKRAEKAELRRFTRRSRRRRIAWLSAAGIVVALAALLAVAVYSPVLALREIRVEGTTRLDPAVIHASVDGQLGTPLALLDDARLTAELGDFPLIRSYTTELLPPSTMVIHIVERQPIAVVASAGGFELVDPAGIVVDTVPARPDGIPLVQLGGAGVGGAGVDGAEVGDPVFLAMTEVLLSLPPDVQARIDSVAATTKDDVTFALTGSQQRVVWGSADNSKLKASVFTTLLSIHAAAGPGEYDVSAPRNPVFHVG